MTLARVQAWVRRLPPAELDLPLLIVDGAAYTPRAALEEVRRGTALGARLQALVESGRLGTSAEEELALAKLRLVELLRRYPPDRPLVAVLRAPSAATYTPRQLIEEVLAETPTGRQWLAGELQHMRRLVGLAVA